MLESDDLLRLADELEEIQRELNRLGVRHEEISEALLAHWGHTSVEEVVGRLGKLLLSPSFKIAVDPDTIQRALSDAQWKGVTARVLNATLLLALGAKDESVRPLIIRAIRASATIKITPPSSRRPKSGQPEDDEE